MNLEKIEAYLDSLVEERGIPSVDCIIYENHKQVFRHMHGASDIDRKKALNGSEQYLMFSMTKVQTMTAIMQLVEKGIVSLNDPVSKYLPAYADLTVASESGVKPAENTMLIRHLVSMQSGLDYNRERPGILRVLKEKGQAATTRELVDAFVESPLEFEPGTRFRYSLSHDVAAAVVEVASGMSFGEYLKKNIWEPLKMDRTFFAHPMNDDVERLAVQHIVNGEGQIVPMSSACVYQLSDCYQSGGAGLISCTEDYSKLADTLAGGGISADGVRILEETTIDTIKTNLLCGQGLKDIETTMGRRGYGYGCGMQVLMNPELIGSSAPKGVFGWDGAAGAAVMMDTVSKRSIVYVQHVRNCNVSYNEFHPALRDMVFGE